MVGEALIRGSWWRRLEADLDAEFLFGRRSGGVCVVEWSDRRGLEVHVEDVRRPI